MVTYSFRKNDSESSNDETRFLFQKSSLNGRPSTVIDFAGPLGGWQKRSLDIAISTIILVLVTPFMLVFAIAIFLSDGGSPIFMHQRVGFAGRRFPCLKLRTMRRDAAEYLEQYLKSNPVAARQWAERRKLRHDPRITWLGRILRISSLDEFPQFFNVLAGHMSCVGPRPITAEELEKYGNYAGHYLSTRPGLTGLWQVSGRSETSFAQRVKLDRDYVEEWSLFKDLAILARTPKAVLEFHGAY